MTDTRPSLLELPASTVVAGIAGDCLDDAAAAIARLADRRDTEAMHDFRVAIRRLRSNLGAYRPWLRKAASRKVRRRFRGLGAATNAARDAEIQLEWLEKERASLSRGERSGLNWLVRRLRETRRNAYATTRRDVRETFEDASKDLKERLAEMPDHSPPLRTVLAGLLRDHVEDLAARLATIRSPGDRKPIHETRIRAKRLRYLLEPLRRESGEAKGLVRSLKTIQDHLGQLHDVHVLEVTLETGLDEASRETAARLRQLALAGDRASMQREKRRDTRLGLVTLAAHARVRRDELFHDFEKQWLAKRVATFVDDIRRFASSLEPSDEREWSPAGAGLSVEREQSPDGAGLPVERERKYLLSVLPERAAHSPSAEIEQGWLPGKMLRERIRRVREDDRDRYFRTVKLGSGIERIELEEETTAEVFDAMWPLTKGCRIAKRRYRVEEDDLVWEIDAFDGRDLVLAEVELAETNQHVPVPAWLEPAIVREVTEDPAYLNLTLATSAA